MADSSRTPNNEPKMEELERKYRLAVNALRSIAQPRLGGKEQQWTAQAVLRQIGEDK